MIVMILVDSGSGDMFGIVFGSPRAMNGLMSSLCSPLGGLDTAVQPLGTICALLD